jgi:hypothetical protein
MNLVRIIIVVDALDECDQDDDVRVINFLSYPIWWPGRPFFCHRSPPLEFRLAPLKNQRLGKALLEYHIGANTRHTTYPFAAVAL